MVTATVIQWQKDALGEDNRLTPGYTVANISEVWTNSYITYKIMPCLQEYSTFVMVAKDVHNVKKM